VPRRSNSLFAWPTASVHVRLWVMRFTVEGDLSPAQVREFAKLAKACGARMSEPEAPKRLPGDELCDVADAAVAFRAARELDEQEARGGAWYARVAWLLVERRLKKALDFDSDTLTFERASALLAARDSDNQTAANWIEHAGPARLRSRENRRGGVRISELFENPNLPVARARETAVRATCKRIADARRLRAGVDARRAPSVV
jgi:hypothetical protein